MTGNYIMQGDVKDLGRLTLRRLLLGTCLDTHTCRKDLLLRVVLLLLLLSTSFGPVGTCKFRYPPIDTSDFSQDVKPLKDYLLLDYGVWMPSNLKPDTFCGELWDLHLINENLKKLIGVSGKCLAELFMKIYNHTKFIEGCNIKVDSSINFVQANISQFVDLIPLLLQSLSKKMEDLTAEGDCADFQNCTFIQRQIDNIPESSTVIIATSVQKLEKKEFSQAAPLRRSSWGLLLLLPVLLVSLVFIVRKRLQHSSSAAI